MEESILSVKKELERERQYRIEVEQERDWLLTENERLNNEIGLLLERLVSKSEDEDVHSLRDYLSKITTNSNDGETGTVKRLSADSPAVAIDDILIFDGSDTSLTLSNTLTVSNAANGMNVICSEILSFQCNNCDINSSEIGDILLCGGVDKCLSAYDIVTGVSLFSIQFGSPVLLVVAQPKCAVVNASIVPSIVACGMMDGTVALVRLYDGIASQKNVVSAKYHSKYIVSLKWCDDGCYLASCSSDQRVCIMKVTYNSSDDKSSIELQLSKTIECSRSPECIEFVSLELKDSFNTMVSQYFLVVGQRDTGSLLYICCDDTSATKHVSLNENDWETHISFSPLLLSRSPDGKYLLVATDKDKHIILRVGSNKRVRMLVGHKCGDYGKPVVAWDCSGRYIYSTSQDSSTVIVYSFQSGNVITEVAGHTGIVRSLTAHPFHSGLLLTASYDKSIKLWKKIN